MRKMKLWFISVNRVSDKDFVRYGLQELALKGVDVEVIDLSELMWGTVDDKLINKVLFNLTYCTTLTEFKSIVERVSTVDIVLCGGALSPLLHHLVSRRCKYIGLQVLGAIPQTIGSRKKILTILLNTLKRKYFIRRVVRKFYSYLIFKRYPFFFVQRGGYISSALYPGIASQTKILDSQCYDIYEYLYVNQINAEVQHDSKEEYMLWIDQAIPLHTDTLKCNGDISHYAESYFSRIQLLLKNYEDIYRIKVVVSLHPRMVNDPRYIKVWKGWNVIEKNTITYIKNAKLCLTHNSTAIHAVAFFYRPLVIVKDKLLTVHGYDIGITDSFFDELDCNLVESDSIEIPKLKFAINQEKYNNYIYKYVSNTSVQEPINANVLYNFILNLSNKVNN